ncbi:MAG: Maf family protein [Christensenellales bacterium]
MKLDLILASTSARRRELLAKMGYSFSVVSVEVDETSDAPAFDRVRLLAERKARSAAKISDGIVIGADTMVVLGGEILGKPRDAKDAFRMLHMLSGQTHVVATGVCVINTKTGREIGSVDKTYVTFRELTEEEILAYIDSGDPMDKAGAYGIQNGAGAFVTKVEGSIDNVSGLPTEMLAKMIEEA